jgi:hypothetical protein
MKRFACSIAFVLMSLPATSFGQKVAPLWDVATAQRHEWIADGKPCSIRHDLGTSALAYDPATNTLYTTCEKYPRVLRFGTPLSTKPPAVMNVPVSASAVDFEAMAFHQGTLYVVDEDVPCLYQFDPKDGTLSRITIDPSVGISSASIDANSTDSKSIEGLVVSDRLLISGLAAEPATPGPYFYLLDESDMVVRGADYRARLYVCSLGADRVLRRCAATVEFPLSRDGQQRLPELFLYQDRLYAIRSTPRTQYEIVRLHPASPSSLEVVCDVREVMANHSKVYFNLEGAAVGSDGTLYLITDNENRYRTLNGDPELLVGVQDSLGNGARGETGLFSIKLR